MKQSFFSFKRNALFVVVLAGICSPASAADSYYEGIAELLSQGASQEETTHAWSNANRKLYNAIAFNDAMKAQEAIDDGANVRARNPVNNMTSLGIAAAFNNVALMQLLLDKGADINARNDDNRTALIIAACTERTHAVAFLLEHGADTTLRDKDGKTAAQHAREIHRDDVARMIIQAGVERARAEQQDANDSASATSGVAPSQKQANPETLVQSWDAELGVIPETFDLDCASPGITLIMSSDWSHDEIPTSESDSDATLPYPDSENEADEESGPLSVLDRIKKSLAKKTVKLCSSNVSSGASAAQASQTPKTSPAGQALLEKIKGWDDVRDAKGRTKLMNAIREGKDYWDVYPLLENKCDPNIQNKKTGNTALIYAIKKRLNEIVELLLDYKADPTQANNTGQTPLMYAADSGDTVIMETLLEKAAAENAVDETINALDTNGVTALTRAVIGGHEGAVKILLHYGAKLNPEGQGKWTPIRLAHKKRNEEMLKILLRHAIERKDTNAIGEIQPLLLETYGDQ